MSGRETQCKRELVCGRGRERVFVCEWERVCVSVWNDRECVHEQARESVCACELERERLCASERESVYEWGGGGKECV